MARFEGDKNTTESREHEIKILNCVLSLKLYLEKEYPYFTFSHSKSISKDEIIRSLNVPNYTPSNQKSSIKPDGGVLYVNIDGKKYPILISEAKKQGTNVKRMNGGLKKQAQGNAIERAYKNIEECRLFCKDLDYFPYVIFAYGCDFEEGSSILDRLDAMTYYEPRNVNYSLCGDKKVTIYVQENAFTFDKVYDKIKDIVEGILKHIQEANDKG